MKLSVVELREADWSGDFVETDELVDPVDPSTPESLAIAFERVRVELERQRVERLAVLRWERQMRLQAEERLRRREEREAEKRERLRSGLDRKLRAEIRRARVEENRVARRELFQFFENDRLGGSEQMQAATAPKAPKPERTTAMADADWDEIDDAKPSEGGVYFQPGNYLVEIDRCKRGTTRKGKLPFFVVECLILLSDNKELRPGTFCSWMSVIKPETPALGNTRKMISVGLTVKLGEDVPLEAVKKAELIEVTGENNPLKGVRLRVSATNIKTKANTPFTVCKFTPPQKGDETVKVELRERPPSERAPEHQPDHDPVEA